MKQRNKRGSKRRGKNKRGENISKAEEMTAKKKRQREVEEHRTKEK